MERSQQSKLSNRQMKNRVSKLAKDQLKKNRDNYAKAKKDLMAAVRGEA